MLAPLEDAVLPHDPGKDWKGEREEWSPFGGPDHRGSMRRVRSREGQQAVGCSGLRLSHQACAPGPHSINYIAQQSMITQGD